MNEILKMLNALSADELDSVIMRASIMLEKKRKEEAEQKVLEQIRLRQEKIEQEKRRQEEIAELQRKLKELQSQTIVIPSEPGTVNGDNFVMHDAPKPANNAQTAAAPQPAPAQPQYTAPIQQTPVQPQYTAPVQPQPIRTVSCPHCHSANAPDSVFCASCGQRITKQAQPAPQPAPAYQPKPAPAPVAQQQANTAQVHYADESMAKWEMLPGERSMRSRHEIILMQPAGGKFAYYMEVTNQRILFTRESNGSKNAGLVARMGGGLVGSLIAEGVKAAAGAGPRPWVEIPLAAVSSCGLQNKKEFYIVADQTYVLKNKSYEKLLPDLVASAKR